MDLSAPVRRGGAGEERVSDQHQRWQPVALKGSTQKRIEAKYAPASAFCSRLFMSDSC